MKPHLNPKNSTWWLPLSLKRNSCAGRKQGARRKKDRRIMAKEWQEKRKSTKQALARYSEAKDVLKTTC